MARVVSFAAAVGFFAVAVFCGFMAAAVACCAFCGQPTP
jgi:hypothetical protein